MMAWKNGEPGIIFIDEINKYNPTPNVGKIESTNPCGEQPLLPYESCNLGSINLTKIVEDKKINWDKLRRTIRLAVRFLDNVVDANKYPIKEIEEVTKANRKIGLGVMGFADFLIQLGISYASGEAVAIAEKVMKFIDDESKKMSEELGIEKGSFVNFRGSVWENKCKAMRNATTTTIAPTGTLSVIADCSSGIEPIFAVSYIRDVSESLGHELIEVNPFFERMAIEREIYSEDLMKKIAKRGSIQGIAEIPEDIRKIFVTALDIAPEWHVRMQAAFQKYTDNAVSKTINFPNYATPHDVEKAFMLAWKLKCKGLTVYRYGSREVQVLNIENGGTKQTDGIPPGQGPCPTCSI
jgi:ribonucleoside-diphosphate reductase alpha chain